MSAKEINKGNITEIRCPSANLCNTSGRTEREKCPILDPNEMCLKGFIVPKIIFGNKPKSPLA
jgi:hypothetical protein